MVDQTLPEINAVHEKNKARRYYYRLEQDFKKWLKQCPVKITGRSDVIHGKNSESGLVTIEFYKKVRRK